MKISSRRLSGWLGLLLFALLCATLAWWAMQWLAPLPPAAVTPPAEADARPTVATAGQLFGAAGAAAAIGDVVLLGVVAARDGTGGVAIVKVGANPARAFRAGAEIRSGVRIAEIHAGHVLLAGDGVSQRIMLPARPGAAAAAAAVPAAAR